MTRPWRIPRSFRRKRGGRGAEKRFFVILHELRIISIPKSSAGVGVLTIAAEWADVRKSHVWLFLQLWVYLISGCTSTGSTGDTFVLRGECFNVYFTAHTCRLHAHTMNTFNFSQQKAFVPGPVPGVHPLPSADLIKSSPWPWWQAGASTGSKWSSFLPLILCASASSALVWPKRT